MQYTGRFASCERGSEWIRGVLRKRLLEDIVVVDDDDMLMVVIKEECDVPIILGEVKEDTAWIRDNSKADNRTIWLLLSRCMTT